MRHYCGVWSCFWRLDCASILLLWRVGKHPSPIAQENTSPLVKTVIFCLTWNELNSLCFIVALAYRTIDKLVNKFRELFLWHELACSRYNVINNITRNLKADKWLSSMQSLLVSCCGFRWLLPMHCFYIKFQRSG